MESSKIDNKKEISTFKSHDEILKLLEEIKSIEKRLKDPEKLQKDIIEAEKIESEIFEDNKILDMKNESLSSELKPEIKEDIKIEKNKDKIKKIKFPFIFSKKNKQKRTLFKDFLNPRSVKSDDIEFLEWNETSNQVNKETEKITKPFNSTFTLKINDEGELIGFNIKKSKSKGGKKYGIIPFRKKSSEESSSNNVEESVSGIKEKIINIFSKIRRKKE